MKKNSCGKSFYSLLLLVLCLISFSLGYFLFRLSYSKETKHIPISPSIVLNTKPIIAQDITVSKNYVGHAEAINMVKIIPYVNGYLDKISVQEGQTIKQGDEILTIDSEQYRALLEAAESDVMKASAELDYNKKYYERIKKSGSKAFSETEVDNAKNVYLQSEANLKRAISNKDAAQFNYEHTYIFAPITGLIGNFNLSIGDYVSPQRGNLLTIVQTDPIRVVFSLTDVEYLNLKSNGAPLFKDIVIKLKTSNGAIYEHIGDFKYTDNRLDKKTNSLAIYAYFKNDKNKLLPNSFVTIVLEKKFKNIVIIDKNFITMKPEGYYVNIVRENKIVVLKVNIITSKDDSYVLENNFKNGDLLLLDDVKNISSDTQIKFNIIN